MVRALAAVAVVYAVYLGAVYLTAPPRARRDMEVSDQLLDQVGNESTNNPWHLILWVACVVAAVLGLTALLSAAIGMYFTRQPRPFDYLDHPGPPDATAGAAAMMLGPPLGGAVCFRALWSVTPAERYAAMERLMVGFFGATYRPFCLLLAALGGLVGAIILAAYLSIYLRVEPQGLVTCAFWDGGERSYRYDQVVRVVETKIRFPQKGGGVRLEPKWVVYFDDGRNWVSDGSDRKYLREMMMVIARRSGRPVVQIPEMDWPD